MRKEVLPLVQADLCARVEKGTKEYGEPLMTNNGRDALWDAYEEVLDLAMYLRQKIEEERDPEGALKVRAVLRRKSVEAVKAEDEGRGCKRCAGRGWYAHDTGNQTYKCADCGGKGYM